MGVPYELDRDLNTMGLFNYEGKLPSVMSAHPKLDPSSGELLSIAYDKTGALAYLCANKRGQLVTIVPFQGPWGTMVHDISITENHVVAFIGPFVFDRSLSRPATWRPDRGTMVAVIPRNAKSDRDVIWIQSPPFFPFQTMNAFEDGNRIDEAYIGRKARFGYVGLRDPRPGEKPQIGAFEGHGPLRFDLRQKDRPSVSGGRDGVSHFLSRILMANRRKMASSSVSRINRANQGEASLFSMHAISPENRLPQSICRGEFRLVSMVRGFLPECRKRTKRCFGRTIYPKRISTNLKGKIP